LSDKKTIKKIIAGVAALAVVGAIAYGANLSNAPAEADKSAANDGLYPIKTWSKTDCSSTPWVVADQKGFFAEEGLKIIYTGDTQPAQQLPSVINGNNDVGNSHPNTLAVAVAGGAKLKGVVAGGIDPAPDQDPKLRHMRWYVKPDSGIHTFADLNKLAGKVKFSIITNNTCADFLANNIADHNELSRDKIEWVSMPDIQAVQALKQGLVTVSGVHPPYYKSMEDAGAVYIADSLDAQVGPEEAVTYYYFTEDYIAQHPDIVKKFARAIVKAQKWSNEHQEESRQLTENWIHVPVSATHYYYTSTELHDSFIDPWIHDLENSGVIPKGKIKSADLLAHL
jgi:ABC-type nitrate/sulfonate/bicarbonate transport system substrate-binding protein